jgi:hypothetical protein
MVLCPEILVFHQFSCIGLLGQREPITTLENQSSSKYSFQKPIQFSQGNNVLDVAASNIDGVSSTCWIGLFGTKWAFLLLENSDLNEILFSKTN